MISRHLRIAMGLMLVSAMLGSSPGRAEMLPLFGPKVEVGKPAPPFILKTFARETIKLEDLRGHVIVLNMWATWCAPCKEEMPMMDAYFRANKAKGLRIYGVQTEDSVRPIRLKELSEVLAYPLTLQFRGNAYDVYRAVPTSYVIDRTGIVRFAQAGVFTRSSFHALLAPLLAEPMPAGAAPKY